MSRKNKRIFEFGPFTIDTVNRQLMREGRVVPLKAKAVDTLLVLIEAIAYAARQEGIGNIWLQPLDGSAPKQLTHWSANPIFSFDWSRDGKWLAYASGSITSDVVMISDIRR